MGRTRKSRGGCESDETLEVGERGDPPDIERVFAGALIGAAFRQSLFGAERLELPADGAR